VLKRSFVSKSISSPPSPTHEIASHFSADKVHSIIIGVFIHPNKALGDSMRESQIDVWLEEVNSPVSPLTETFEDVPLTPIDRRSSLPHSLRAGVPASPAALAEQTKSEVIWDVEQASFVSHDIADAIQSESLTIFEQPADRNSLDPFRFYQAPKPRPEYASPGPNLVLFDADREDGQHRDFPEAHSGEDSPTPRYPMLSQNAGSALLNGTPFDGASGTSTRSSLRVPEREAATMRICESPHRSVTMNQGFHLTALLVSNHKSLTPLLSSPRKYSPAGNGQQNQVPIRPAPPKAQPSTSPSPYSPTHTIQLVALPAPAQSPAPTNEAHISTKENSATEKDRFLGVPTLCPLYGPRMIGLELERHETAMCRW